jgi:hypothetical protein
MGVRRTGWKPRGKWQLEFYAFSSLMDLNCQCYFVLISRWVAEEMDLCNASIAMHYALKGETNGETKIRKLQIV